MTKADSTPSVYIEVNPDSGFTTKVSKKTTTYMVLDKTLALPFYSINVEKTLVPMFDVVEEVTIGEKELNAKFDFVAPLD